MGSLFRNPEGLDTSALGMYTDSLQSQAASIDDFSTTLFQKYNAMRAANQAGDAQADAWDLTKNTMTPAQMTDSIRQKDEFVSSQTVEQKKRTYWMLMGIVALGAVVYVNQTRKDVNPVAATSAV